MSYVVLVVCVAKRAFALTGFSWSWGPLGWLVPSEVHTIETRSPAQGITVCVNFLMSFLVGQVYLTMLCK